MTNPSETPPEIESSDRFEGLDSPIGSLALSEVNNAGDKSLLVPSGVLTDQDFIDWAMGENFGDGRRGTYKNESHFLYIKACHQVKDEAYVMPALEIVRDLTSRGVLHPDTQWGVYKKDDYYQLFPVSPKIEPITVGTHLGTEVLETKLKRNTESGLSPAVIEWLQRVEPNFSPDDQQISANSLLRLLNVHEASHSDNWGIDTDGTMYPVDTEVINLTAREKIISSWQLAKPKS